MFGKFDLTKILGLVTSFMPTAWKNKLQALPHWVFGVTGALGTGLATFVAWSASHSLDTTLTVGALAVVNWFIGFDPEKPLKSNGEADDSFKG